MGGFRKRSLGLIFALCAGLSFASPDAPKAGVDYTVLQGPVSSTQAGKVDVLEFYGYFCPHCYHLDSFISDWAKTEGDKLNFKRLHVSFGPELVAQQRMAFAVGALKGMKEIRDNPALKKTVDGLHNKIFSAIHVDHNLLLKEDQIRVFMEKEGISKELWEKALASFDVDSKIRLTNDLVKSFQLQGVPTIVVGGKYITSPAQVANGMPADQSEKSLDASTIKVLHFLIDKVVAEGKSSVGQKPEVGKHAKAK